MNKFPTICRQTRIKGHCEYCYKPLCRQGESYHPKPATHDEVNFDPIAKRKYWIEEGVMAEGRQDIYGMNSMFIFLGLGLFLGTREYINNNYLTHRRPSLQTPNPKVQE